MRLRPRRFRSVAISGSSRKASTGRGASAASISPCGTTIEDAPRVAGERMGATQGFGQGKPRGEAGAGEACSHVGEHRLLPAEEMWHAGDVEPEPVIAVGIQRRAVTARGPAGEIEQSVLILTRRGGKGEESGTDGARIGEAEAGEETLAETCRIDRA